MARLFDSTEYVSRTSGPSATAFTLMAWYRVDSYAAPADWQGLLDLRTASGPVCEVTLDASGNLDLWNNSSSVALIAHPAVGDWFHVYVRCSGSGAGLLQGGAALVGNAYTTNTHTIGFTGTANLLRFGGNAFDTSNHRLAAIKVWDVALTDAEIEAERYLYQPRKFANLHLWAPMVQSVLADQLKDFSGNARDFTATGTHAVVDGPPISWGAPSLVFPYAVPDVTQALTGSSATGSAGTVVPTRSLALSGFAATSAIGTLTATGGDAGSPTLTGLSGTGGIGALVPTVSFTALGQAATGSPGSFGPTTSAAISGLAATGAAGALVVDRSVSPSGLAGTGGLGAFGVSRSLALSGSLATGAAGQMVVAGAAVSVALTGAYATGSAGSLSVRIQELIFASPLTGGTLIASPLSSTTIIASPL